MKYNRLRALSFTVCAALAWPVWADQDQSTATGDSASPPHDAAADVPMKVEMPMKMDEPMQGGMKKKGMMKGDVKKSAEKQDEKMREMLEKEEQSMPSMPPRKE